MNESKMSNQREELLTPEAAKIIKKSLASFKGKLMDTAIGLALREKVKGEKSIEITASHVEKAEDILFKRRVKTRAQTREFILRMYLIMGITLGITGVTFSYFKKIWQVFSGMRTETRMGVLIALIGFGMTVFSAILLWRRKFTEQLVGLENKKWITIEEIENIQDRAKKFLEAKQLEAKKIEIATSIEIQRNIAIAQDKNQEEFRRMHAIWVLEEKRVVQAIPILETLSREKSKVGEEARKALEVLKRETT